MAGILKRLESWAADSPARSRFLVLTLCLTIGIVALAIILVMAWLALGPGKIVELVE